MYDAIVELINLEKAYKIAEEVKQENKLVEE